MQASAMRLKYKEVLVLKEVKIQRLKQEIAQDLVAKFPHTQN